VCDILSPLSGWNILLVLPRLVACKCAHLAARLLGTVPSVVMGGAITLAVVATVAWRAPALRRLGPLAL